MLSQQGLQAIYASRGSCDGRGREAQKLGPERERTETGGRLGGKGAIVSHSHLAPFSRTGKMPVKRRVDFLVGWAGEPARARLINNGARYQVVGNRDFRACS